MPEEFKETILLHYCNAIEIEGDQIEDTNQKEIGKMYVGVLVKNILNEEKNGEIELNISKKSTEKYVNDLVNKGVLKKIETRYFESTFSQC